MEQVPDLIIIRNGDVYAPFPLGKKDLLVAGGKIVAIADHVEPPNAIDVTVIDASGRFVVPGLIDLHIHILGGGGEDGPSSRVPEIQLSALTQAGTTTVVGVLGTDRVTRSPDALLAKARALRDNAKCVLLDERRLNDARPTINDALQATIEGTEESILSALLSTRTVIGRDEHRRAGLPIAKLLSVLASLSSSCLD